MMPRGTLQRSGRARRRHDDADRGLVPMICISPIAANECVQVVDESVRWSTST
jgi:IS5 family transposase